MKPLPSGTPCAIRSGVRHCGNGSERASRSSTTVTADADGEQITEARFTAFGEIRYESGDTTTDKLYTGQRQEYEIGLDYYVARFYDPYLNHFTQPDTIIADPYNPMAWNRYAYANYYSIKYTDPTGYFAWIAVGAIIGAAINYGIQVYDNYESDMSDAEAWIDVSVGDLVGGAIIGARVVALAPVAVAAAGDLLVDVGITTGPTALIVAGNDAYGLSQT